MIYYITKELIQKIGRGNRVIVQIRPDLIEKAEPLSDDRIWIDKSQQLLLKRDSIRDGNKIVFSIKAMSLHVFIIEEE